MSADDPYVTLGIEPGADEAAIRAAYRAAMKRYHPDQNSSADAAERASEVAAAYKLLCDPKQRARLDQQRLHREQVIAPPTPRPPRSAAPRGRLFGGLLVVLSLGIVGVAVTKLDTPRPPVAAPRSAPDQSEDIASTAASEMAPAVAPPAAPVSVQTVEPELAQAGPSPEPPSSPKDLRTERGPATLPAKAVPVSRLVPAAVTVPHAKQPVRTASATPTAAAPKPVSDDCDTAATCARIDLAALERMQTLLYNQSYLNASSVKQARLLTGRSTFLARLGRCTSAACKRDAYLARNREIAELMRS